MKFYCYHGDDNSQLVAAVIIKPAKNTTGWIASAEVTGYDLEHREKYVGPHLHSDTDSIAPDEVITGLIRAGFQLISAEEYRRKQFEILLNIIGNHSL